MICVDASVAVKWILTEEHSDKARTLYLQGRAADETFVAPMLFPIEVTNVLHQRLRAQPEFSLAEASVLLDEFLAFEVSLLDPPGLHQRALALANTLGLPAVYDAHYLALAERQGCEFWTDDRRLLRIVGNQLPYLRGIEDYSTPS